LSKLAPFRTTLWPLRVTPRRFPLLMLQSLLTAYPDDPAHFLDLCERVPSWTELFRHAELHGVAAILHKTLGQAGYTLPAAEKVAIGRRVIAGRLIQRSRHQGMMTVLAAINKARIRAVPLKGTVLSERLYGDASLRFSMDLDILISPRDLEAVAALLNALGYLHADTPTGRYERAHTHNLTFYQTLMQGLRHAIGARRLQAFASEFLQRYRRVA